MKLSIDRLPDVEDDVSVGEFLSGGDVAGHSAFSRELMLFERRLAQPRTALERPLVPPMEWLDDPYLSGSLGKYDEMTRTGCWPATREFYRQVTAGDYNEMAYTGAFGTGKTDGAIRLLARWLYELSCYASPQALLGLQPHSVLVFMLVHMKQKKAEKKLFQPLKNVLNTIPYFRDVFTWDKTADAKSLRFEKGIEVRCGITDPEAVRSEDLVCLVVDECNFLAVTGRSSRDKEGRTFDAAESIYQAAKRRQDSRFTSTSLWTPKIVLLSSRDRPHDFLERREREILTADDSVIEGTAEDRIIKSRSKSAIYFSRALWKAKPPGSYPGPEFVVEVGGDGRRSRIIHEDDKPSPGAQLIPVPGDFREAFTKNVDEALRELAGVAIAGVGRLIQDDLVLADAIRPYDHPFSRLTTTLTDGGVLLDQVLFPDGRIRCCPDKWRFGHVDVALTQDCLGLCFLHVHDRKMVLRLGDDEKYVPSEEPVYRVDLALQVLPPHGSEIRIGLVESLVLHLKGRGMKLGLMTADTYQSSYLLQSLEDKGVPTDVLSVDRKPDQYLDLRDAFEERRMEMYDYPPLMEELSSLIYYRAAGKVDHPPSVGKDVADALAGSMAGALRYRAFAMAEGGMMGMAASVVEGTSSTGRSRGRYTVG